MVICGHSWSLVIICGYSWSSVVTSDHSWSFLCTFRQHHHVMIACKSRAHMGPDDRASEFGMDRLYTLTGPDTYILGGGGHTPHISHLRPLLFRLAQHYRDAIYSPLNGQLYKDDYHIKTEQSLVLVYLTYYYYIVKYINIPKVDVFTGTDNYISEI